MISAPTVANIVRNAAYTIYRQQRIHEPAVLRLEHSLRTGPLVKTEFDGLSIEHNKIVVSEVKKRYQEYDSSRLKEELSEIIKEFKKRVDLIKRYANKRIEPQVIVFHNTAIDDEYLKRHFEGENVKIITVPYRVQKMPPQPVGEETTLNLIYGLLIEFFSLPRLLCENMASAISCGSPPYDAMIDDLKRSLGGKGPSEFSERISEKAEDPERLSKLHPCQAVYSLGLALRVQGRRRPFIEVIERYTDSIKYVANLPFLKEAFGKLPIFMTHSVYDLASYLENQEGSIVMPMAPQKQQEPIRVCCIDRPPKKILVLLSNDYANEAKILGELILQSRSFKNLEKIYVIDMYVMRTIEFLARQRGIIIDVEKIHPLKIEGKEHELFGIDIISTDLFLSYKRNRRLMRFLQDRIKPDRVMVLHRGLVPPSIEKKRARGRHSLEVM